MEARQLQDNPLLNDILNGISDAVLNQLKNTEISIDEKMKIRLFDYYQITELVRDQIQAFVKAGEVAEMQLDNVLKMSKLRNHNP